MGKFHTLPTPKKGKVHSYVFMSDTHSLQCDPRAVGVALKLIDMIPKKQRRIILGGDILDMAAFYQKDHSYQKAMHNHDWDGFFIPEIEKEAIWWEEFYRKISTLVADDHLYYLLGNHEQRLERPSFIDNVPHNYKHNFNIREILKIKNVFDYNDCLCVNIPHQRQLWTHGIYCGANPVLKHVKDLHSSIVFGHCHEEGLQSFKAPYRPIRGIACGCLCLPDPKYLENKNTNWSQGIVVSNITHESVHHCPVSIIDGTICLADGRSIVL